MKLEPGTYKYRADTKGDEPVPVEIVVESMDGVTGYDSNDAPFDSYTFRIEIRRPLYVQIDKSVSTATKPMADICRNECLAALEHCGIDTKTVEPA